MQNQESKKFYLSHSSSPDKTDNIWYIVFYLKLLFFYLEVRLYDFMSYFSNLFLSIKVCFPPKSYLWTSSKCRIGFSYVEAVVRNNVSSACFILQIWQPRHTWIKMTEFRRQKEPFYIIIFPFKFWFKFWFEFSFLI